ncbi:cysteine-rich CWC family protein [Membranihabitans marinus]|uniref:cysteine-rich CWC family protein n=1 Tax=Membranihabitans marinus TaxID=1227546 RepID=UPI00374DEE68
MKQNKESYCPRCLLPFECRVDNISLCHCNAIILTHEEKQYIAKLYQGCLCNKCILELKSVKRQTNH